MEHENTDADGWEARSTPLAESLLYTRSGVVLNAHIKDSTHTHITISEARLTEVLNEEVHYFGVDLPEFPSSQWSLNLGNIKCGEVVLARLNISQ